MNSKGKVKRHSGGRPQIPKGDGDDVVQQYIEACPEWNAGLGDLEGYLEKMQ